jgi:creatinine amidohydrolase
MYLTEKNTEELGKLKGDCGLIVPLGSLEAHGPHLPMGTDIYITNRFVSDIEPLLKEQNIIVSPMLQITPINIVRWLGEDGHWNPQIDVEVWVRYAHEVVRSLITSLRPKKILLLTWHDTPEFITSLRRVSLLIHQELGIRIDALRLWIIAKEIATKNGYIGPEERHAAKIETSIMQFILPDFVKPERRENCEWSRKDHYAVDWDSYTEIGIYGNAKESSAKLGKELVKDVTEKAKQAIIEYFKN